MSSPPRLALPPNHFLSLPRPTFAHPYPASPAVPDTGTLAGADYDVDVRTGFMPPQPPLRALPEEFAVWERVLERAGGEGLKVGDARGAGEEDWERAERWRVTVREMPVLSIDSIRQDVPQLRRAHQVLAVLMHFYIHSAAPPPPSPSPPPPIHVPAPISLPLIATSHELGLTPILTYSDTVLWNWVPLTPSAPLSPTNITCLPLFTTTPSEAHFYTVSAQIELRGVEALSIMRSTLDEAFVADSLALRRITAYLSRLSRVIDEITVLLRTMRDGCDPAVFYNDVRPWFRGSSGYPRKWIYEGADILDAQETENLAGPSAGQSSLVHALDVFLGVDHTHRPSPANPVPGPTFMTQMEKYMPGPHRRFLHNLRETPNALRPLVLSLPTAAGGEGTGEEALRGAYDGAVMALKRFRDEHIRIVTLYIVNQRARADERQRAEAKQGGQQEEGKGKEELRGTGGTRLVPFLKETRGNTQRAVVGKER